jgi:hypothetical protein
MKSLRTVYGKLIQLPKGHKFTPRQKNLMKQCSFLKDFMRQKHKSDPTENGEISIKAGPTTRGRSEVKMSQKSRSSPCVDKNLSPSSSNLKKPSKTNDPFKIKSSQKLSSDSAHSSKECQSRPDSPSLEQEDNSTDLVCITEDPVKPTQKTSSTTNSKLSETSLSLDKTTKTIPFDISVEQTIDHAVNLNKSLDAFNPQSEILPITTLPNEEDTVEVDVVRVEEEVPPLMKNYLELLKNVVVQPFNRHEYWARLLAEKLKLIDSKKAEQIKVQIDAWILQFLPDNLD